jgi:hypothetical protein
MNSDRDAISFGKLIPETTLRAQYTSVTIASLSSPSHGCRIVLPRSAAHAANVEIQSIQKGSLSVIAGYQLTPNVFVQISGTIIEFEINLVDWLDFELQRRGGSLEAVQALVDPNGQVVHGNTQGPGPFRGRVAVKSNGCNIILLAGRMPNDAEADIVETLGLAAASLDLTSPLHQQLIEPLSLYRDQNANFQFLYPKSWSIKVVSPRPPSIGAVEIKITNQMDTVSYLRVHFDSSVVAGEPKNEKMKKQLIEELKNVSVVVSELQQLAPLPERVGMARFSGVVKLPTGEGMVALATQATNEGCFGVVLVSPGRIMNPLAWMRAKRSFEIVTGSLSKT